MRRHRVLKYILDILGVISEIEGMVERVERNFRLFQDDLVIRRAIERDLEIIGEALSKLLKEDEKIEIAHSQKIIGLRNIIIHAYDTVDEEIIWGIVMKHIPDLKDELLRLKSEY